MKLYYHESWEILVSDVFSLVSDVLSPRNDVELCYGDDMENSMLCLLVPIYEAKKNKLAEHTTILSQITFGR